LRPGGQHSGCGLAAVGLLYLDSECCGWTFGANKAAVIGLEAFAVISGIITMSVILGLKNFLVNEFTTGVATKPYIEVNYVNGLDIQVAAWILSLVALLLTIAAKKQPVM